jgi:hypothetical protein
LTTEESKTVVLGPEYDVKLRDRLREVLKALGAVTKPAEFALAGSQEIHTQIVDVQGQKLTVEAETYVGLSISGPSSLVDEIAALVAAQGAT